MKQYIQNFCLDYEYPKEAIDYLIDSYDKISSCTLFNNMMQKYIKSYDNNGTSSYIEALQQFKANASLCGISHYTVHFLYCICLTKELKKRLQSHQIPESICQDSIKDLKYKLIECHKVYGIWGTFVADWFQLLFDLRLYALGRLEFEVSKSGIDYHKNGNDINFGDTVVNVHIPSSGPLLHESCLQSYEMAKDFFNTLFDGKKICFICHSWLLFPEHEKFLPAKSNIRRFAEDFEIYKSEYNDEPEDLWRIFDKEIHSISDCGEPKTSLQKAYYDWISKGNKTGFGSGISFL